MNLDKLTLKSSANGFVMDRIGDAVLVDDLRGALELHRQFPKVDFITRSGEIVYASGERAGTEGREDGAPARRAALEDGVLPEDTGAA